MSTTLTALRALTEFATPARTGLMEIESAAKIPPPERHPVATLVRELGRDQTRLIPRGNYNSIKSILARLRKEYRGKREFTLQKVEGGVRVWRTK